MTTTPELPAPDMQIKIGERDAAYLVAYFANRSSLTAYDDAPPLCPECAQFPDESDYPHISDKEGNVLIGCEGYWTVDPGKIGLDRGNWDDYRQYL
jgi:hypothetical protein